MWVPYSPRAKNALVGARKEMRRLGDHRLGTEHVLLGILSNEDGTAVRMLARLGVAPEALEERLLELRGRAASGRPSCRRRKGAVKTSPAKTKTLLACGAIGGPLFVVAFVVEGASRANYEPLRHPVSSLALGDSGWTQTASFVVAGLLTLALAVGLRRAFRPPKGSTWGPLLVGVWAIGLLGAGSSPPTP